MRILALYDIHGNLEALEAVLNDPRAAGADVVIVGGDAVPGPLARATLECLDAIADPVHWLRGNGEREVAEALNPPAPPADGDMAAVTATRSATEIGADRVQRLASLPLTLELDGVLFCHASPRRDDEMLTRLSTSQRWNESLAGTTAELIVGGHTHQQDDRTVGMTRFVNAGSVGLPYEGDGSARWLWLENGTPALRHTAYNAAQAGERMLRDGWPDERSIRASLIAPIDPIEITRLFESQAGEAREGPGVGYCPVAQ